MWSIKKIGSLNTYNFNTSADVVWTLGKILTKENDNQEMITNTLLSAKKLLKENRNKKINLKIIFVFLHLEANWCN